ncbi:MAG: hypothetical protein V4676_03045 [Bacteroidota bacterium]
MKTYFCLIAVSIFAAACNSNSGTNLRTTSSTPPVMNVNTTAPITDISMPQDTQTRPLATPATATVQESKAAPATSPAADNKTAKLLLNPAHGLPGHRCDLAVGAPLNSAPAAKTAVATTQQATAANPAPVTTTSPVVASATQPAGVKPKLNPAHGLPFHDCAIEVGKPLKN